MSYMQEQIPNYEERKCYICGGDTYKNISGKIYWFNDKDKNGYKTGRYICYYCHFGIERHSPNYDDSEKRVKFAKAQRHIQTNMEKNIGIITEMKIN